MYMPTAGACVPDVLLMLVVLMQLQSPTGPSYEDTEDHLVRNHWEDHRKQEEGDPARQAAWPTNRDKEETPRPEDERRNYLQGPLLTSLSGCVLASMGEVEGVVHKLDVGN